MFRSGFIVEPRIRCAIDATSKKRLLEALAELLASSNPRLSGDQVFERLLERERLGSTGLGHGIALPHARAKEVAEAIGAFVSTARGVDYDAADGEPVDLAFALLVPETAAEEHLQILARLAGLFSDPLIRERLREAQTPGAVLGVFQLPPLPL